MEPDPKAIVIGSLLAGVIQRRRARARASFVNRFEPIYALVGGTEHLSITTWLCGGVVAGSSITPRGMAYRNGSRVLNGSTSDTRPRLAKPIRVTLDDLEPEPCSHPPPLPPCPEAS